MLTSCKSGPHSMCPMGFRRLSHDPHEILGRPESDSWTICCAGLTEVFPCLSEIIYLVISYSMLVFKWGKAVNIYAAPTMCQPLSLMLYQYHIIWSLGQLWEAGVITPILQLRKQRFNDLPKVTQIVSVWGYIWMQVFLILSLALYLRCHLVFAQRLQSFLSC